MFSAELLPHGIPVVFREQIAHGKLSGMNRLHLLPRRCRLRSGSGRHILRHSFCRHPAVLFRLYRGCSPLLSLCHLLRRRLAVLFRLRRGCFPHFFLRRSFCCRPFLCCLLLQLLRLPLPESGQPHLKRSTLAPAAHQNPPLSDDKKQSLHLCNAIRRCSDSAAF